MPTLPTLTSLVPEPVFAEPRPTPEQLPQWLREHHLIRAFVKSTAEDLPARTQKLFARLQQSGWSVVPRSIDTSAFNLGLRSVDMMMRKPGATRVDAVAAVAHAAKTLNEPYHVLAQTAEEYSGVVKDNIVSDLGGLIASSPKISFGAVLFGGMAAWAYAKSRR